MLTFVMLSNRGKILLSVSNDLHSDQRVHKVCTSLMNAGYEVELIGRYLKGRSTELNRPYKTKRFRLWFNKGPLFYLNLNLRLFFYLAFSKADILLANDLDTLMGNFWASRVNRARLVYDSHEYFTEVPELVDRPRIQSIWKSIEAAYLPKVDAAYTVSPSIARVYRELYGIDMSLVRNFPLLAENIEPQTQRTSETSKDKIVIYQGALNIGRGLEELINAFSFWQLEDAKLWIFGAGDIENELKAQAKELGLEGRVTFFGRVDPGLLKSETKKAKIGVSIEHAKGLNYEYALPNKVFDYIHSSVPVLYSNLKDLVDLIDAAGVGEKLNSHDPEKLANQLAEMLVSSEYENWRRNCIDLSSKLNWENEEKVLLRIFDEL